MTYVRRARHSGFTLLETVLTVGIVSLLMGGLALLFLFFSNLYQYELAYIRAHSAGSAIRSIAGLTLQAQSVLGSHTFGSGSYTSNSTTLVLKIPTVDASGVVIPLTYDYMVVYVSGSNLYQQLEPDASSARVGGVKLLTDSLKTLLFTYDNADYTQVTRVTVDITTEVIEKTKIVTNHIRQDMPLRNSTQ